MMNVTPFRVSDRPGLVLLHQVLANLVHNGVNKVAYSGPLRLLRFARNDKSRACRCEERSDEAIPRGVRYVTVFVKPST